MAKTTAAQTELAAANAQAASALAAQQAAEKAVAQSTVDKASAGAPAAFNNSQQNFAEYKAEFVEQDTPETPNDFDWAILDLNEGAFYLHMEEYSYFDLAIDAINNGSSQKQCAISYSNLSQKDPSYVSIPYTDRK